MDRTFLLNTLGGAVLGMLGYGIMSWAQSIQRMRSGQALLPWEPRRPVPWGLVHLIVAILLVMVSSTVGPALLHSAGYLRLNVKMEDMTAAQQVALLVTSTAGQLLCVPLFLLATKALNGATAADFGWSSEHLLSDIKLGLVAFTMLAPIVFAIQLVTTQFQKSEHPILKMLEGDQGFATMAAVFFTAAIGAPILEELFFRVLLQGWLEKLVDGSATPSELLIGNLRAKVVAGPGAEDQAGIVVAETMVVPSHNPYASPSPILMAADGVLVADPSAAADSAAPANLRRLGWLPMLISSVVFALLHWSHGPDWIALTVLAIGFGFLYQRTHRIVPSLVVHALLNSFSLLAMFVSQKLAP